MDSPKPHPNPRQKLRARGAVSNDAGRFEPTARVAFEDGWDLAEDPRLLRTEVRVEEPRSAITYNTSPDLPFDRSINPYRGCEHGCIYCFARPTHAFLNLSPGLDFETKLIARPGIAQVLDRELRARSYKVAPIALGTNTDPYQPIEAEHRVMRDVLTTLLAFRHPVAITTKGTLVERDLDLLVPLAEQGLTRVGISITTLDPVLSRKMEPRAPSPARRLAVIAKLAQAGVSVRVMVSPLVANFTKSPEANESQSTASAVMVLSFRECCCYPRRGRRKIHGSARKGGSVRAVNSGGRRAWPRQGYRRCPRCRSRNGPGRRCRPPVA